MVTTKALKEDNYGVCQNHKISQLEKEVRVRKKATKKSQAPINFKRWDTSGLVFFFFKFGTCQMESFENFVGMFF